MKDFTPARKKLVELGWKRCDRRNRELWMPPKELHNRNEQAHFRIFGYLNCGVSFTTACRRSGISITKEDKVETQN